MTMFRVLMILVFATLALYTGEVIAGAGMGYLGVFFGDIARVGWPGQFNLDFAFMLLLSGLWVAWRHEFSAAGILLGLVAFNAGTAFLSVYLLVTSLRSGGDVRVMLLGTARAAR